MQVAANTLKYKALIFLIVLFYSFSTFSAEKVFKVLSKAKHVKENFQILISPYPPSLYTPKHPPRAILLTMDGRVTKTWTLPRPAIISKIRDDGNLYSLLLTEKENRVTGNPGECDQLIVINSKNQVVNKFDLKASSHDFTFLPENKTAVLFFEKMAGSEIKKIIKNSTLDFGYGDKIKIFENGDKEIWSWSLKDHLGEIKLEDGYKDSNLFVSNSNSLQYIPVNPISKKPAFLISMRHLDILLMIEYPSGNIVWQSQGGGLSRQHDATFDGKNVLVFNNNLHTEIPNLQLQKIDPIGNSIVYKWSPKFVSALTTSTMGGVREIGPGHFLVSLSNQGLIMEVNDGQIVGSYLIRTKNFEVKEWPLGEPFFRLEVYQDSFLNKAKLLH